jgi:hypothetical protein
MHRAFAKELESSGVTEFTVKIAEKQVRELFDVVIKGRIDESRSQFRAELEGSTEAPLKDFSEQTPFALSMTNVSSYRSAKYQDWLEPVVVVAGDSFADFCLYYDLSRLRDKVAWVLPEWITVFQGALARARAGGEKVKEEEMHVHHFAHVLTELVHYGTAQNRILLLSRSLDRAHLDKIRDALDEATLSSPGTFKSSCDVGEFTSELLGSPLAAYETDNIERDYTKQLLGNKLAGRLDTPKPRNFSTVQPSEHRWITEFNIREHAFPCHPSLGTFIVRESRLGTHGVRSGRNGVAYFCPNVVYFAGWGDIDRVVIKPEIFVPDAFEIFTSLLGEQKLTARVSDKGFFGQEAIRKFGSLGYLAEYFRNKSKRAVLEKFRDTTKPQEGVHDEGVLLASDNRRYLNFDAIRKIVNDEEKAGKLIDDLVQRAVLYRGFIFKCGYCRNADWFQVGDITEEFHCKRCGRRQVYVREHWRQPREPAWFYKLDEIIFQGIRNDMIVPVLALDYIRRKSESFLYTPELEVVDAGAQPRRSEIDICCIPDGVLTVGEAKTDNRLGSTAGEEDQEIAKYRALARKIAARQVVFATISPAWSDTTTTKIREAFAGTRMQVALLAQNELLT